MKTQDRARAEAIIAHLLDATKFYVSESKQAVPPAVRRAIADAERYLRESDDV